MGKFCVPDENFEEKKSLFLHNIPSWNCLVQEIMCLGNLSRTQFLVTFDRFHGNESLSVDFMITYIFCATDGQNANP